MSGVMLMIIAPHNSLLPRSHLVSLRLPFIFDKVILLLIFANLITGQDEPGFPPLE